MLDNIDDNSQEDLEIGLDVKCGECMDTGVVFNGEEYEDCKKCKTINENRIQPRKNGQS
jgi:hypothetical protein